MSIRKVKTTPPIPLPFPISPTLRVAQLSPGPQFAGVQPFMVKRLADLSALAPNVVIGSLSEIQHLASYSKDATCIDHALVILTRYGSKPLNDIARVALWQSFGVPIFELYLGLDHSLLAYECEAHEGWHLAPGIGVVSLDTGELILDGAGNTGLRTGLTASFDQTTCPCGSALPRILEIEPLRYFDERFLAVSA